MLGVFVNLDIGRDRDPRLMCDKSHRECQHGCVEAEKQVPSMSHAEGAASRRKKEAEGIQFAIKLFVAGGRDLEFHSRMSPRSASKV